MNPTACNDLSHEVIGAAIAVPGLLGLGLLESTYAGAYAPELSLRGHPHERQKLRPVHDKGMAIDAGDRIDIIADQRVVGELKAVEKLLLHCRARLLTYLRLGSYPLGLLLSFHPLKLVDGIERGSNPAPHLS